LFCTGIRCIVYWTFIDKKEGPTEVAWTWLDRVKGVLKTAECLIMKFATWFMMYAYWICRKCSPHDKLRLFYLCSTMLINQTVAREVCQAFGSSCGWDPNGCLIQFATAWLSLTNQMVIFCHNLGVPQIWHMPKLSYGLMAPCRCHPNRLAKVEHWERLVNWCLSSGLMVSVFATT